MSSAPGTVGTAAISVEHVSLSLGGPQRILDDLSFEVSRGETLSLLGASGCGKTTTLRILAGLEVPDAGRVTFDGRTVVSVSDGIFIPPERRGVGMVFQSYAIWPHMSVFDNVAYPLRARRAPRAEIASRVDRALGLVGLGGLGERRGTALSGGQQQRVALARSLVYEPQILLLDEPFSNLDSFLRREMRDQLADLLTSLGGRMTAVFVTHDQREAFTLSDRVALMRDGRIEQLDSPTELYRRPSTPFARDSVGRSMLLSGTVVSTNPGTATAIVLPDGETVRVTAPVAHGEPLAAGDRVIVCVRPEDITIGREPVDRLDGELNAVLGHVVSARFGGPDAECRVLVGDVSLQIDAPARLDVREGEDVHVRWRADAATVWRD